MAKCKRCDKKGLFLKLTDGLCTDCVLAVRLEAENAAYKLKEEQARAQVEPEPAHVEVKAPVEVKASEEKPEKPDKIIPNRIDGHKIAYNYNDVKIFIAPNCDVNFSELDPGDEVTFEKEPDNPYDSGAIFAKSKGRKIGYIYRGTMQDMIADFMDDGLPILSHISFIDDDDGIIKLFIAFYRNKKYTNSKTYTLSGNSNEEAQENILFSNIDDEVEFVYDYDKEKYAVYNASVIGFLPKSANEYIESLSDYEARISDIYDNDSGKSCVKIEIRS